MLNHDVMNEKDLTENTGWLTPEDEQAMYDEWRKADEEHARKMNAVLDKVKEIMGQAWYDEMVEYLNDGMGEGWPDEYFNAEIVTRRRATGKR